MSGPQIRVCLFTFRPIASKHLNSLTTIDTLSWLGGAVVTHPLWVQEVPGSIPGSGKGFYVWFLAHLSTKCSWWAIVVSGCPSSVVVRRVSTFDVYTLKTTFVIWFLWNFVRMFVLTISRPSSNMDHVRSKTRSLGQILGNSCLHSRGHISNPILMKHCQTVCFDNI